MLGTVHAICGPSANVAQGVGKSGLFSYHFVFFIHLYWLSSKPRIAGSELQGTAF